MPGTGFGDKSVANSFLYIDLQTSLSQSLAFTLSTSRNDIWSFGCKILPLAPLALPLEFKITYTAAGSVDEQALVGNPIGTGI